MENGSLFTELLEEEGFHLVVHGHKHYPRLVYAPGAGRLPVLGAGSFSAALPLGLASRTRNLFHIVTLMNSSHPAEMHGFVRTWQFQHALGWTPSTWQSAGFPHRAGFGSALNPLQVAQLVERALTGAAKEFIPWAEVLKSNDALRFVPPKVWQAAQKELSSHGLRATPDLPDEPDFVGRLTTNASHPVR